MPERPGLWKAPSRIDSDWSGRTASGSTSSWVPRPVHSGQAPWGVLRGELGGWGVPWGGAAGDGEGRGEGKQLLAAVAGPLELLLPPPRHRDVGHGDHQHRA